MIFAQYKNDESTKTFSIEFANTEFPLATGPGSFKPVNATYHLENAINKAFDGVVRPEKVHIKVNDAHNFYLKVIAIQFTSYVRGLGYNHPDLTTENF